MSSVVYEAETAVIGAGAAGCVLAARLTQEPTHRVVLIEAGPDYPTFEHLPPDLRDGRCSAGSHDWAYRDEATGAPVARARVVGGCSATNGTIALRAAVRDFEGWAALGNPGWCYADVLPAYRRLEDDQDFADRWHGRGGPLPIRRYSPSELTTVNAAAYEAAVRAGFPEVADHNRPGAIGLGAAPVNAVGGTRMSAAMTYLAQARDRANLTLLADTLVDRVLIEDGKATGVVLADGRIVRSSRVVLAAGAYGSPALLLRSGVGPADELRALGIDVHVDLPAVGANLQEHPGVSVTWPLAEPQQHSHSHSPSQSQPQPQSQPQGPRFQIVATWASGSDEEADFDMQHVPAATAEQFWISAAVMTPRSRGTVKLTSADPAAPPRIRLNLLEDPLDLARMIDGVRSARHIGANKPLTELAGGPEQWPGAAIEDDRQLATAIKSAVWAYHHASGTCAMGPNPEAGAVVDPRGSVHGVNALTVADASIMPVIPSANTHLTTLMIAERIAEWLTEAEK